VQQLQGPKHNPDATISLSTWAIFYATFTKGASFAPPPPVAHIICGMGHFAGARDLRNLLSVAAKLRLPVDLII
jgi:hypothetical protein